MKVTLEQNDRQFLHELHRMGSGTVQEICAMLGVTATAVRQRLVRLQGVDLVSRDLVRAGRGRPHHVYRVTDAGLKQLGENYTDLAMILWREMKNIEETDVRQRVVNRVRDALVQRYGQVVQGETLNERVGQLQAALAERGFDVEVDQRDNLPILRENNCPYPELAGADASICELEQQVFQRVLGVAVKLTRCCRDGDNCCEFEPSEQQTDLVDAIN